MLIDTHCHLHDREFFSENQAEEILKRARERGVEKIVCIGTSHEDSMVAREFAIKHEGVYWTYGVHPENANEAFRVPEAPLRGSIDLPVAIGEVGLDYHYPGYDRNKQIKLFEKMLQLATENDLPASFHVREAFDDFFAVVNNFPKVRGVVHSFSDNKKNLRRVLNETDFYVGVNGMATYSTLPTPPLARILLETDAPFLTPTPFRGIMNECGYVVLVAEWLSKKLSENSETIEQETTKNAKSLFRF